MRRVPADVLPRRDLRPFDLGTRDRLFRHGKPERECGVDVPPPSYRHSAGENIVVCLGVRRMFGPFVTRKAMQSWLCFTIVRSKAEMVKDTRCSGLCRRSRIQSSRGKIPKQNRAAWTLEGGNSSHYDGDAKGFANFSRTCAVRCWRIPCQRIKFVFGVSNLSVKRLNRTHIASLIRCLAGRSNRRSLRRARHGTYTHESRRLLTFFVLCCRVQGAVYGIIAAKLSGESPDDAYSVQAHLILLPWVRDAFGLDDGTFAVGFILVTSKELSVIPSQPD